MQKSKTKRLPKYAILFITFIFISGFLLAACNGTSAESEKDEKAEEPVAVEAQEEIIEPEQGEIVESGSNEGSIEVDKGLFSVEITMPASFFEGEDIDEIVAKAKEDGISEVIVNDDGSVTYKMSKLRHNELIKEMRDDIIEYLDELKNSGDYESIKDIAYNKNFTEFTILVNREKFENSFDGIVALGIGITSSYYQIFDGVPSDKYKATIFFKDEDTGEVFHTVVFPDSFEEME